MKQFSKWFGVFYGLAAACYFVYWHPFAALIVAVPLAALALCICRESGRKKRELARQGFHIERVPAGLLRGEEANAAAIVYHDVRGEIIFPCWESGRKLVVSIPTPNAWQNKVPPWADGRREQIIERIRQSNSDIVID